MKQPKEIVSLGRHSYQEVDLGSSGQSMSLNGEGHSSTVPARGGPKGHYSQRQCEKLDWTPGSKRSTDGENLGVEFMLDGELEPGVLRMWL